MKAQTHEHLQIKFSQTRGRMSEFPGILILGSLEIIPTKQAVSSGPFMALGPPKVGEVIIPDVSAAGNSDQFTLTAHNVHRILFVWLVKWFINVINPFSKRKQKIRKPSQVLKQGHRLLFADTKHQSRFVYCHATKCAQESKDCYSPQVEGISINNLQI